MFFFPLICYYQTDKIVPIPIRDLQIESHHVFTQWLWASPLLAPQKVDPRTATDAVCDKMNGTSDCTLNKENQALNTVISTGRVKELMG